MISLPTKGVPRRRFVGRLVARGEALLAEDPFTEAVVPLPAAAPAGPLVAGSPGEKAGPGAIVEVDLDRGTVTVLCAAETALASLWALAFEERMDPVFPDEVLREVEAHLAAPGWDDPALEDLEAIPFVTIDGATSRDLDQAVHVEALEEGHRVRYALADAAHYAPVGSAIFEEALQRGATYYLPGLSIPMLPRALSEGLTSLNPNVPRRALVFDMVVGEDGTCRETRVARARIRSRAKLSFEDVQTLFDRGDGSPLAVEPFATSLLALRDVGRARLQESATRDVVRYRRQEVDVRLEGAGGLRFVVTVGLRAPVEVDNEQVSLLVNREGARLLLAGGAPAVQPIYRVHPAPDPTRVEDLGRTIAALVRVHGLPPDVFAWGGSESSQSLAAYLQGLPDEGPGERVARAIHRQAILVNLRSGYATKPSGHYGVGAEVYARFSAPMREVVGVFLHKEMLELLGVEGAGAAGTDEALRERVVEVANLSKQRQRRVTNRSNQLVLDQLFRADLALHEGARPVRRATVMGLSSGKIHVQLDAPTIDVKLYVAEVARARGRGPLDVDEDGVVLVERATGERVTRVGDAIDLRVERQDEARSRWVLGIVALP